ncbi:hypothetical protein [Nocardia wallacei]|uniref:hypothetical protein n=1 Tax=Nocardia wallacei TaxID=480035 RepID=UPI002457A461|nr:hypothetical protein [Nocardia wallacei]
MDDIDRRIRLSAIRVQWSAPDRIFIASTDQFPGITYRDESSLVAMSGLVETLHDHIDPHGPGSA